MFVCVCVVSLGTGGIDGWLAVALPPRKEGLTPHTSSPAYLPYMPGNVVHICVVKTKLEPISTGTILDLCDVNS